MKKAFKITGFLFSILFILLLLFAGYIYMATQQHWDNTYELSSGTVKVVNDQGTIFHDSELLSAPVYSDFRSENLEDKNNT